jgi:hypothetical protein
VGFHAFDVAEEKGTQALIDFIQAKTYWYADQITLISINYFVVKNLLITFATN